MKDELPKYDHDGTRNHTEDGGTDWTCSSLIDVEAHGQTEEGRQGISREPEKRPAEEAEAKDVEKDADDKHGGGSHNRIRDYAFHHHHGATGMIAENNPYRQ